MRDIGIYSVIRLYLCRAEILAKKNRLCSGAAADDDDGVRGYKFIT